MTKSRTVAAVATAAVAILTLASGVSAQKPVDWKKIKKMGGSFSILVDNAAPSSTATPLVDTELRGFILNGTFSLKQTKADESSVLYEGPGSGFLFLEHKAGVLGGEAVKSEQTCGGSFKGAQVMLEIFPKDKEYQVSFDGEVPGCKLTTKYPLQEKMARIFAMGADYYRDGKGEVAAGFTGLTTNAQVEFETFAKAENRSESVTFSAATVPDMVQPPNSKFPVMKFISLPATAPAIRGSRKLHLAISTSVAPTVIKATAIWAIDAEK